MEDLLSPAYLHLANSGALRTPYAYELPRPVMIALVFEAASIGVTVDPETDNLLLMKPFRSGKSVDVSLTHPWERALGRECLWAW